MVDVQREKLLDDRSRRCVRADREYGRGHELSDWRVVRLQPRFALAGMNQNVRLGNYSERMAGVVDHDCGPERLFGEEGGRLTHRRARRKRDRAGSHDLGGITGAEDERGHAAAPVCESLSGSHPEPISSSEAIYFFTDSAVKSHNPNLV